MCRLRCVCSRKADNSFLVLHHNVPCLGGLSHHVEYHVVAGNLKVHINLHAALMGVGRHGVPYASLLQHGHAHGQLAGLKYIRVDKLVDNALIGCLRCSAGPLGCLCNGDVGGGVGSMGRCAYHVELSRCRRVVAGKYTSFVPFVMYRQSLYPIWNSCPSATILPLPPILKIPISRRSRK